MKISKNKTVSITDSDWSRSQQIMVKKHQFETPFPQVGQKWVNIKIPVYEMVSFWPSTLMVSTGLQFIANFRCIQEIPWASRNSERPFTSTCFHVPSNFERFSLNICLAYLLRFIMKKKSIRFYLQPPILT